MMERGTSKLDVILLKSSSTSDEGDISAAAAAGADQYVSRLQSHVDALSARLGTVRSHNLLAFDYCNLDELANLLGARTSLLLPNNGEQQQQQRCCFRCLIVTSRQTCEAIERSLHRLALDTDVIDLSNEKDDREAKLVVYCVGEATAARFRQLALTFPQLAGRFHIRTPNEKQNAPEQQQQKRHKHNAKELAACVVADFVALKPQLTTEQTATYALYPCSDIRRDEMSTALLAAGIGFRELTAYKTTHSRQGLLALGQSLVDSLVSSAAATAAVALVFFSPSACEALFETSDGQAARRCVEEHASRVRLVSVGPSTTAALLEAQLRHRPLGLSQVRQMSEPSPAALLDVLQPMLSVLIS